MKVLGLTYEFNFGKHQGKTLQETIDNEYEEHKLNAKGGRIPGEEFIEETPMVLYFEWCIINVESFFVTKEVIDFAENRIRNYKISELATELNRRKVEEFESKK